MSILNRVHESPFISKIYLDFIGNLNAVKGLESQNFYNSSGNEFTWKPTHFSKQSVSFRESEKITKAGSEFTQTLIISFPNADALRNDRIEKIKACQFVQIELSNKKLLVLGRNDYYQNRPLEIKASNSENKTTITFTNKSMFSCGYLEINKVNDFIEFLIPNEIPNSLIPI